MSELEVQKKQENIKNSIGETKQRKLGIFVNELKELKTTEETKERTEEIINIFTDHADEVLESIRNTMVTNFSKINMDEESSPKLATYIAAKEAFDTDINSLIKLNTPEAENTATTENTPKKISKETQKLNKLLELTSDIGSLIQLKKLES